MAGRLPVWRPMKWLFLVFALALSTACLDSRRAAESQCGSFGELCPVPVDPALVESITTAWLLELDPMFPRSGPMMFGAGGDSAWTVAVYGRLRAYRPDYFVPPADTLHAPHLTGITVERLGDTVKVTTSVSEC